MLVWLPPPPPVKREQKVGFLSPSFGFLNNTSLVSGYIKAMKRVSVLHEAPTSLHLEDIWF